MDDMDLRDHKVKQLREMLKFEEAQPPDGRYGAHLDHWSGHGTPINIDAGALRLLIRYYGGFDTKSSCSCDGNQKKIYLIEDQINDCLKFMGIRGANDAHDMNEQELEEAENLVAQHFDWVEHPDYAQLVPKCKHTGHLVLPKEE